MKICLTGSAGFIMGYLVEDLLRAGHEVVGIDNFSKYGEITRSYDTDPRYKFTRGDCKDVDLLKRLLVDCDVLVAGAAKMAASPISTSMHMTLSLKTSESRPPRSMRLYGPGAKRACRKSW